MTKSKLRGLTLYIVILLTMHSQSADLSGEWRFVGSPPTSYLGNAILSKGNGDTLFAGGDSGVAFWSGRQWVNISHTPVDNIAYSNGKLYVVGNFWNIGGTIANDIAQWNGVRWSSLGKGINFRGNNGLRKPLVVSPEGNVYVGGDIDSAGGQAAHNFAYWDGLQWDSTGGGQISQPVTAMAMSNSGTLYVGYYTIVKRRLGGVWIDISPIVSNSPGWDEFGIYTMAVNSKDELYLGGAFSELDKNLLYTGLLKWNGVVWSAIPSVSFTATAITFSASGKIFVLANYNRMLLRIDNGLTDTIFNHGSDLWGSTDFLMAKSSIVAKTDSTCAFTIGFGRHGIINYANGHNVSLRSGFYQSTDVSSSMFSGTISTFAATSPTSLFSFGRFQIYNGEYLGDLIEWNGSTWKTVEIGDAIISNITADRDSGIIAIINKNALNGVPAVPNTFALSEYGIRYNNDLWSTIMPWQFPWVTGNSYHGYYSTIRTSSFLGKHILKWNGSSWDTIGVAQVTPIYADSIPFVTYLSVLPNGNLIAAGRFDAIVKGASTVSCNSIAQWDGASWSSLDLSKTLYDNNVTPYSSITKVIAAKNGDIFVSAFSKNSYKHNIFRLRNGIWSKIAGWQYGKCSIALDSADKFYLAANDTLSVFDGTVWQGIKRPSAIPSIYNITDLNILSDNSLYCVVRENGGYGSIMRFTQQSNLIAPNRLQPDLRSMKYIISSTSISIFFPQKGIFPIASIRVVNMQGRIIRIAKNTASNGHIVIPINDIPNGMYVLNFSFAQTKGSFLFTKTY